MDLGFNETDLHLANSLIGCAMTKTRTIAVLFLVVFASLCFGYDSPHPPSFVSQVAAHFAAWDRNNDGVLSRQEIDVLVSDPKVAGTQAAAVVALKRAVRNTRYQLPPLTRAALTEMGNETRHDQTKPDFNAMYALALNRIEKANKELFPSGPPTLTAIQQGKLGNCFCLAPLGALVCRDSQDVVKMIQRDPNGPFSVRLGHQVIQVPTPTDAELALMSSASAGLWVNVYEKAVGRLRQQSREGTDASVSFIDLLGKGGSAGTMVEVVTGHQIVRFACKQVRDAKTPEEREAKLAEARALLSSAFAEKRLVTCGTGAGVKVPNLNGNHAYAVIGYDPKADQIALWNPHGQSFTPKAPASLQNGYPTREGRFAMPLPEFMHAFAGLAFETKQSTLSSRK